MRRLLPLLVLLAGCWSTTKTPTSTTVDVNARKRTTTTVATEGVPADVLNPAVTQATIKTTICVVGWTATVRPPVSVTTPIKRRQIVAYGYTDTNLADYEEDHMVPLEIGGNPSTATAHANLWPEPNTLSHPDDGLENTLKTKVCAGTITLAAARQTIWQAKVAHGYQHDRSAMP